MVRRGMSGFHINYLERVFVNGGYEQTLTFQVDAKVIDPSFDARTCVRLQPALEAEDSPQTDRRGARPRYRLLIFLCCLEDLRPACVITHTPGK